MDYETMIAKVLNLELMFTNLMVELTTKHILTKEDVRNIVISTEEEIEEIKKKLSK